MASPKTPRETFARMKFGQVYPHYLTKVEKKGHSREDLHQVITWLTGFDDATIQGLIEEDVDFETMFDRATLHPNAHLITGVICGYRVEEIDDDLIQKVRYLDKLVDEVARGKKMTSILRSA